MRARVTFFGILTLVTLARSAVAATPVPLLEAVARAPQLQAARQRIDAAHARTGAAGRLADVEVEAMSSRVNADTMGENRDMWELNVRQPLPKRGERAADRARALAVVGLTEADYASAAGELAAEVAISLAEAAGADARAQLIEAQLTRLGAVLQTLQTRLAAGASTRLADRLTIQSRVASLQLQLAQAQRASEDSRSAARGQLGLAPDAPLPAFAAPEVREIDPADSATLALATARIAEANAMGKMARASANPMTSVGLRFERERGGMGNQDTIGVAFSSEIPWRSRRYARADVRAAEADRAAAQADATAARHRISSTLARVERAERVADTARRLAGETQVRLSAEHESLTRATSVGVGTGPGMGGDSIVLHAVDILDKSTETQLQIIEAETAARTVRADLWRYVSAPRLLSLSSKRSAND